MLARGVARNYVYLVIAIILVSLLYSSRHTSIPSRVQTALGIPHELTEAEKPVFNPDQWGFQADIDWQDTIQFDFERLRGLPPKNYQGPGHETYATLYVTRDGTVRDPYFLATQQIIYRLLWGRHRSKKYPVTVFVTSYVNETFREYFRAAGAMVRELGVHPFEPKMKGVPARLQDMFSKYDMWKQFDFSRILYLDGDAIPLQNIDSIWDEAPERACKYDLLPEEDKAVDTEICKYVFAATPESQDKINAGVMVFKPDHGMYERLMRGMLNTTGWDTGYLEQSLLSVLFQDDGPFPPTLLDHKWNSFPTPTRNDSIMILHDKMWMQVGARTWVGENWADTYSEMLDFYRSDDFVRQRYADRDASHAQLERDAVQLGYAEVPSYED